VPTYDYRCTKCGDTFAIEQSIHDKPLTRCKKCRGKLEKMLPRTLNLIFKGSGFYVTDYKKPGPAPAGDLEKKSDSGPGSGAHPAKSRESRAAKSEVGAKGTESSE
jgi:putative FmdB family regulatory protein